MTPSNPDTPRSPLATALMLDAVQRIEADGPLDDQQALRQAFATQPTRAAQVQERAWLLGQRLDLPHEWARWRQMGWLAVAALALLMAFTGLGLARAVLGEGRSINAVAAFVSLLGLHAVMLLIWFVALALSHGRWAPPLGRAALWLTARLPFERGPHAPVLLQSFTAVQRVGNAAVSANQREWAWWLMGCVVVYGLLPRALLAALCLWRWRAGTRRLQGQVDMADPYVLRLVQRLDALEPPPEVIDPERPAPFSAAPKRSSLPPGAPGSLAVIGFELPPEVPWPLPDLPESTEPPQRIAGSASERQAVLAQLAQSRPESLLLVVHAAASPDRGTARFVREAMREAGRTALLLNGNEGGARRWRDWMVSEGFEALALAESAQAATDWIANRHD